MSAGWFAGLIATAVAVALCIMAGAALAIKRPTRNHIYWCQHPDTGISLPCMYRKNDPVSV